MRKFDPSSIIFPFALPANEAGNLKDKLSLLIAASGGEELIKHLPVVTAVECGDEPPTLRICLLASERPHLFKFFYDVLYTWLIPYQTMGVPMLLNVDFAIPHLGLKLTYCELMGRFESFHTREEALKNLEHLKGQIALGAGSSWFARKLLEMNGISLNEKSVTIHEHVHHLIKRFPQTFDESFFQEMNYALMTIPDPFKEHRSAQHLTRIVSVSYIFKKQIEKEIEGWENKRVLKVNLFREKVGQNEKKGKRVLSVSVGVNFLDQREFLEERHLLKAIQHYLPSASLVPGSFYTARKEASRLQFLYLEVEKVGGESFSSEDLILLRKELPSDLNERVEKLIHPVFMPRNEEEIMRNMLQVAQEVRHVSDAPHALLTFEEQTQEELFYSVLVSKVAGSKSRSFYDLFETKAPMVGFQIETVKRLGVVKNRYPKEVCQVRARLPKEPFLRKDLSIDLYRARGRLVKELRLVIGHFRDLNGGMMAKEKELMHEIRNLIEEDDRRDEYLLENFFFSLQPVRMRTFVDPEHMASLFSGMNRALKLQLPMLEIVHTNRLLLIFLTPHLEAEKELQKILKRNGFSSQECLTASLKRDQLRAIGLLMQETTPERKAALLDAVKSHFNIV